jgi:hypothetical protein
MHQCLAVEEKREFHFRVGGLTPSYERSHQGYLLNITSCCWNVLGSGHLWIFQPDVKTINFFHCRQIWLDREQQSETSNLGLLSLESDWMLNTKVLEDFLSFLTVINIPSYGQWFGCYDFWKLMVAAEILVLDRMERPEWFEVLTIFKMKTQKTLKTKVVGNLITFPKSMKLKASILDEGTKKCWIW